MQNNISLVIRFGLILYFILSAYLLEFNVKDCIKILYYVTLPFVVLLICYQLLLIVTPDLPIHKPIAYYIKFISGIGSIYPSYGFLYKIQIKGCAIIPFVYMVSYFVDVFPIRFRRLLQMLYLMAVVISGNFAYLVSIFGFHLLYPFIGKHNKIKLLKNLLFYLILLVCSFTTISSFVLTTLEEKKDVSNAIRIDQVHVLFHDLIETPLTFLLGKGLGNTVDVITTFRNYTGQIYYEIQPAYFINQLGLIPFSLFLLANFYFAHRYIKDRYLRLVYCMYIVYAITNPYILDTTQVVVIVTLITAQKYLSNSNIYVWKQRFVS